MVAFTSLATLALPLLANWAIASPASRLENRDDHSSLHAQSIHLAVASGCSGKGVSAGSVSTTVTIPTTLADVAAGLSYFHPPNAGYLHISSASGSDNTAGASRTISVTPKDIGVNSTIKSVTLKETIKSVDDFKPFFLDRVWQSSGPATVAGGSTSIPSHSSHLLITPSCSMRAASLTLTTSFCSSDPEFAEALFQELQDKAVEGLNAMYGTYSSCGNV